MSKFIKITLGGIVALILSWAGYYVVKPQFIIINLEDAQTHESKVANIVNDLRNYSILNQPSFDINMAAIQSVASSFTITPSYIRIVFGEVPTNQGPPYDLLAKKMIFGFQFAAANKKSLDPFIYDFDLANKNTPPYYSSIRIPNYEHFKNAYFEPLATNSLLERMECTNKIFLSDETTQNTDIILIKYAELEKFYKDRPASATKIKFRMAAYDNFSVSSPRFIRWHRMDGYFVLNAYHADQNGNVVLVDGEVVPYDLNDLCPPGSCY